MKVRYIIGLYVGALILVFLIALPYMDTDVSQNEQATVQVKKDIFEAGDSMGVAQLDSGLQVAYVDSTTTTTTTTTTTMPPPPPPPDPAPVRPTPVYTAVTGACGGATNGADQFIARESGGNPNIYNGGGSGAWGCYQIMPATWAGAGCNEIGTFGSATPAQQAQCASRLSLSAWGG
jgi:hypothetical protein